MKSGESSAELETTERTITLWIAPDDEIPERMFVDAPPFSPVHDTLHPDARFSMGDHSIFWQRLYDRKGGEHVGEFYSDETIMRGTEYPNIINRLQTIFVLRDGQIITDHIMDMTEEGKTPAAVVGGTGAYTGARGTATYQEEPDGGYTYTINLI